MAQCGVSAPGLRVGQVTKRLTVRLGDGGLSVPDKGASLASQSALKDGGSQVRNLAAVPPMIAGKERGWVKS